MESGGIPPRTPPVGSPVSNTDESSPKQVGSDNQGVSPIPGQSLAPLPLPGASQPTETPIDQRATSPTPPSLNVNEQPPAVAQYKQHSQKLRELNAQMTFLSSIPSLKEQLQQPSQEGTSNPFFILYNDNGKLVKLLPPDQELLKQPEKYQSLVEKLMEQLSVIEERYQGQEGNALAQQVAAEESQLKECQAELLELGINPPVLPEKPILFAFSALMKAFQSGQPAKAVSDPSQVDQDDFALEHFPPPPPAHEVPENLVLPQSTNLNELSQSRLKPAKKKEITPDQVDVNYRPIGIGLNKVQSVHLEPDPGSEYVSIFNDLNKHGPAPGTIASVNSGHPDLAVAHQGINAQFAKELYRPDLFGPLHEELFTRAPEGQFTTVDIDPASDAHPVVSHAAIFRPQGATISNPAGTIIIDALKKNPDMDKNNSAMIYAVAPSGNDYTPDEQGKKDWLMELKGFSKSLLKTQHEWNLHAQQTGAPVLDVLRTPLMGGDLFLHPSANPHEVAAVIKTGFDEALLLMPKPTITHIQFEETEKKYFQQVLPKKGDKQA